jgi:hypothetical protein
LTEAKVLRLVEVKELARFKRSSKAPLTCGDTGGLGKKRKWKIFVGDRPDLYAVLWGCLLQWNKASNRNRQEKVIDQLYTTYDLTEKDRFKAKLDLLQRCSVRRQPCGDDQHNKARLGSS